MRRCGRTEKRWGSPPLAWIGARDVWNLRVRTVGLAVGQHQPCDLFSQFKSIRDSGNALVGGLKFGELYVRSGADRRIKKPNRFIGGADDSRFNRRTSGRVELELIRLMRAQNRIHCVE